MKNSIILIVIVLLILNFLQFFVTSNKIESINDRLNRANVEYQFVVTDSMMTVYDDNLVVGTVKLQGQLDSLLVDYNE